MKPFAFTILIAVQLAGATSSFAATLRAGGATANITPPLGIEINGGTAPAIATHVHDELHARALVLDDGTALADTGRGFGRIAPISGPAARSPSRPTSSGTPMKPAFGNVATSAPNDASLSETEADPASGRIDTAMLNPTISSADTA